MNILLQNGSELWFILFKANLSVLFTKLFVILFLTFKYSREQNHALAQWKMVHCKTVANIIIHNLSSSCITLIGNFFSFF
jgi:hypothetical protein